MTDDKKMPDEIFVYSDPKSLGDMGFTQTEREDGYTRYLKADTLVERLGAMKRGAASEDEAMCQITSIYNEGWNAAIDSIIKEVGE